MLVAGRDLQDWTVEMPNGHPARLHDVLFHAERWSADLVLLAPEREAALRRVRTAACAADTRARRLQVHAHVPGSEAPAEVDILAIPGWELASEGSAGRPYWEGVVGAVSAGLPGSRPRGRPARDRSARDIALGSLRRLRGVAVKTTGGQIGHVDDLLLDPSAWVVRYLVVETTGVWPTARVLLSPRWIAEVRWDLDALSVNLTHAEVRASPTFDSAANVDPAYERRLFHHYRRPFDAA